MCCVPSILTGDRGFPPVERADPDGLLAVGGDLSVERLLQAYESGIFPWYAEGYPILWWSPNPRYVLFPGRLKISASMARIVKSNRFTMTLDQDFVSVIDACRSVPRPGQEGTWITDEMVRAYVRLHEQGYAHSVETWHQGKLAGGLYGVSLGGAFFGESMFTRESNASKAALIRLVEHLLASGCSLIDCQVRTKHLDSLGAEPVPRSRFLELLAEALKHGTAKGRWSK